MRTTNFRDGIIFPAFQRMGYDPTLDLLKDYADSGGKAINAWVRKFWDAADWPELSRTEIRTPTNHMIPYELAYRPPRNWDINTVWNKDEVVRDPNNELNIYISLQNANQGNALSNATWWFQVPPWDNTKQYVTGSNTTPSSTPASIVCDPLSGIVYVAQTAIVPGTALADNLRNPQAWLPNYQAQQVPATVNNIGKILKVYQVDPTIRSGPFDIPFKEYDQFFHVGFNHGQNVWVKFMTRPNQYTLTVWSAATTYNLYTATGAITDLAYDPIIGECYASNVPNNTNHALPGARGNNASWTWVPFPSVLAEATWRGLYSDLLREEGQLGSAQAEEAAAMQELQLSIERNIMSRYDRLTDQQTGVPRNQSMVKTGAE